MKDAAVAVESFTDRLNKAKLAVDAVTNAVKFAGEALQAFADREAAVGRLERSFARAGASAQEFESSMAKMRQTQAVFGVGIDEQIKALQRLTDVTGNVNTAQADLQLAMDISAAESISLAQVSEMLRNVRNGQVRGVQQLNGVTYEQAKALNLVSDDTHRAQIAIELLSHAYSGAQNETAGTADKTAALAAGMKELEVELGRVVASSLSAADSFGQFIGVLTTGQSYLDAYVEGLQLMATTLESIANFEPGEFLKRWSEREAADIIAGRPTAGGIGNALFALQDMQEDRRARGGASAGEQPRELNQGQRGTGDAPAMPGADQGPGLGTSQQMVFARTQREKAEQERLDREARARAQARKEAEERAEAEEMMAAIEFAEQEKKEEALRAEIELRERVAEIRLEGLQHSQSGNEALAVEAELRAQLLEIESRNIEEKQKALLVEQARARAASQHAARAKAEAAEEKKLGLQRIANERSVAQARLDAGQQGINAAQNLHKIVADNTATQALWDSIQLAYKAGAAFAMGNPVAGGMLIAEGAAALALSQLAGGGGGGGSRGGGGGGGGGASGQSGQSDTELRRIARIQAEEQNAFLRDDRPIQVFIDASNQVALDSQRGARLIGATNARATLETIRRPS